MNNVVNTKERLHWVDVAKGVLIVLMAIGHMNQRAWELGVSSPIIDYFRYGESVWSVFFMATFFILSSFWGKYDMSFKDFIIKNTRALLLPLIVFGFIGGILHELFYEILKHTYNEGALIGPSLVIDIGYWFVLSLFVAKCVLWFIFRLTKKRGDSMGFHHFGLFHWRVVAESQVPAELCSLEMGCGVDDLSSHWASAEKVYS